MGLCHSAALWSNADSLLQLAGMLLSTCFTARAFSSFLPRLQPALQVGSRGGRADTPLGTLPALCTPPEGSRDRARPAELGGGGVRATHPKLSKRFPSELGKLLCII